MIRGPGNDTISWSRNKRSGIGLEKILKSDHSTGSRLSFLKSFSSSLTEIHRLSIYIDNNTVGRLLEKIREKISSCFEVGKSEDEFEYMCLSLSYRGPTKSVIFEFESWRNMIDRVIAINRGPWLDNNSHNLDPIPLQRNDILVEVVPLKGGHTSGC